MKDIKIDVDFKDTCIDFGKFVIGFCNKNSMSGSYTMDELWEKYQEKMGKEVKDILTGEKPIMGNLEDVRRYNDYYYTEKSPLDYEDWYLLDKDKGSESTGDTPSTPELKVDTPHSRPRPRKGDFKLREHAITFDQAFEEVKEKVENPVEEKALRYNEGKLKWSYVHFASLEPMVKVLEFGAEKYDPHNWKKGLDKTEILESSMRHLTALLDGEDIDPESGLGHMGHIMCNAMFHNYFNKKSEE